MVSEIRFFIDPPLGRLSAASCIVFDDARFAAGTAARLALRRVQGQGVSEQPFTPQRILRALGRI